MIDQFSKEDFENYLSKTHSPFASLGIIQGEYAYSLPLDAQVSVMIRSSIKSTGQSAGTGEDSIRCWLVVGDMPLGSKVSNWVTRLPGWQDRLNDKIKQLVLWRGLAGDCSECGKAKGIFKVKKEGENKGRPFANCTQKDHKNQFVWLDKPIKTSDIFFSEESNGNKDLQTSSDKENEVARIEPEQSTTLQLGEAKTEPNNLDRSDDKAEHAKSFPVQKLPQGAKSPNSQQQQAITAPIDADVLVSAAPGSGKTFVIEHRYLHLVENGVNPDDIIVVTYSKQSALDMGQRIIKTCPQANLEQICTIHALCYRLLAKWYPDSRWYKWQGPKDWQIKSTLEDIIGPMWDEDENPSAQEVYSYINTTKHLGLTTDDSYEWFVSVLGLQRGSWLYEIRSQFDAWLNRNRLMTFADQLFLVEQKLINDPAWRAMVQSKFSQVVVDEGQDTSYQAMRILVTISLEPGQNTVYEKGNE